MALERDFQSALIKEIRDLIPGCIVLKNDATYIQGIPDLLILNEDRWAALETKRHTKATRRPNQEYYVHQMNDMSYAAFVTPENKGEVLNELQRSLVPGRASRNAKR